MPDCLLCRIVRGELRVERVIESDRAIGVVNTVEPLSRGHCVFFPRRHAASLHEVDDADLAELLALVKRVAAAMELRDYNVLQNNGAPAGQTVFHAHVHLIPRWSETEGLRVEHGDRTLRDHREIIARAKTRLAGI